MSPVDEVTRYYIKLAIAVRIPMAFDRFCDPKKHILEVIPPEELSEDDREYKIKQVFRVITIDKKPLAVFHPAGKHELLDQSFEHIFKKIVEELGYAAYKAKRAQDELTERQTQEFENKFSFLEDD